MQGTRDNGTPDIAYSRTPDTAPDTGYKTAQDMAPDTAYKTGHESRTEEQLREGIRQELELELLARQRKKRKKKRILLILLLLLLCFAGGILFYVYRDRGGTDRLGKELAAELGLLPGMSEEEIRDRLNRNVAEGRFNISINTVPEFKNGRSAGNIRIENIQGNRYSMAVTVTCIGASEDEGAAGHVGETVMTTGLIDPGSYVLEKKLDVDLPKGKYTCVATFDAYKTVTDEKTGEEDYELVGSAGTQILITVRE